LHDNANKDEYIGNGDNIANKDNIASGDNIDTNDQQLQSSQKKRQQTKEGKKSSFQLHLELIVNRKHPKRSLNIRIYWIQTKLGQILKKFMWIFRKTLKFAIFKCFLACNQYAHVHRYIGIDIC
jgi:hypothetical protein